MHYAATNISYNSHKRRICCILTVQCSLHEPIFTARRYASAVLAVIMCLSVRLSVRRLSVRHKSELYKDG